MDTDKAIEELTSLAHLDSDAAYTYEQVLDRVDDESLRVHLRGIGHNHSAHADRLIGLIEELGGEAPDRTPHLTGKAKGLFTELSSIVGDRGVLRSLQLAERQHVSRYQQAVEQEFRGDIHDAIDLHLADEQMHLKYVERALGVKMLGPV